MRILLCGDTFPAAQGYLQQRLTSDDELVICAGDAVAESLDGVDIVIPRMCLIDASVIRAGKFGLVQQWGAGLEGVDLTAARQKGIRVANVPASGSNAESVAEHVIMLTIALLRDLNTAQANIRAGRLGTPIGKMLAGRTVCIYGLGAIGQALVPRLRAFQVRLLGITRDPSAPKVAALGLDACYSQTDQKACLAQTDVLIVCVKLSPDTKGLIDAQALNALPGGAYIVNAARGALVDYDALYSALTSGHLAGAGLDVFWQEPIASDDPLLALPNVIATPHVAGVTDRSYEEIAAAVSANIERYRRGEAPENCAV